ncbi:hypothetical protein BJX64DRAFT_150033 [Aspergillus heterothallicus]
MSDPSRDRQACQTYALSPVRTAIDILVCLLVVGSYIPQIIRITITDRSSNAGISAWYMLLLSLSATSHLATALGALYTKWPVFCVREGYLRGWKALSAVGMVVQSVLHWLAAMALLGVFLYFRHGRTNSMAEYSPLVQGGDHVSIGTDLGPNTPLLEGLVSSDGQAVLSSSAATAMYGSNTASASTTTRPSNRVLLALVITHAVLLIPPAIYIMLKKIPSDDDLVVLLAAQACYIVLAITGFLTSLTAMIPQIHLIITRSQNGLGPGNLSILGTGLQSLSLFALSATQWSRFGSFDPTGGDAAGPVEYFWAWFIGVGASPVGYLVLALGQLVVFCVALGVGGRGALHW